MCLEVDFINTDEKEQVEAKELEAGDLFRDEGGDLGMVLSSGYLIIDPDNFCTYGVENSYGFDGSVVTPVEGKVSIKIDISRKALQTDD